MLRIVALLAAVMAPAAWSGAVRAETYVIGQWGSWKAFGGTSEDNLQVCGVQLHSPDDRSLMVKYFAGKDYLILQMYKPSWNIPAGTPVKLTVQFDRMGPWAADANGAGHVVDVRIAGNKIADFIREFVAANSAVVTFQGNEPPWNANMYGSRMATEAMRSCMRQISNPSSPQAPTQPFSGNTPTPRPPQFTAPPTTTDGDGGVKQ